MTQRNVLATAALLLMAALHAHAATVVDTGTANGNPLGAFALDASDFVAGQVSFGTGLSLQSIWLHLLGGTAGETFTVALYADSAAHLPDNVIYTGVATLGADGWNGLSGLTGWSVAAGTYWIAAELGPQDMAGSGSLTGALLDQGAPAPLVRTAFNAGSGYVASAVPMSFGLRIDAVPEPSTWLTFLVGLSALSLLARHRRPE